MSSSREIHVEVREGDALKVNADVLALKYAQNLYGADLAAYEHLSDHGREPPPLPVLGGAELVTTQGLLGSDWVLFVGVPPLRQFGYQQIREFGRTVLTSLARQKPRVRHLALTIHGPGYGLDEEEAFESQLAGLLDAVSTGDYPADLTLISFIERSSGRAERLKRVLEDLLPQGTVNPHRGRALESLEDQPRDTLRTVGYSSAEKPFIFVAMPFAGPMEDVFHYGIQGAVKAAGFLCERADLTSFSGDIMAWVRQRITNATLVVADLTAANPNVYLEVGYAWGCGRPTILIVRDMADLKFDVKGQRCLEYKSIQHLEKILGQELQALGAKLKDSGRHPPQ